MNTYTQLQTKHKPAAPALRVCDNITNQINHNLPTKPSNHQSTQPQKNQRQETKRGGKPHLHTKAKPVTGANSHAARDFRMHAKPRSEARAGAGARDADFDGGVGRALAGGGSWEEREKALKEGP